jgi:hypothetical protein
VHTIGERGRVYEDVLDDVIRCARLVKPAEVVERILIHLEQQTAPRDFQVYGARVVPFYNYLQAAFVVHEDGRLPGEGVLRVAVELVTQHRFDGDALARSYADLARRGHLAGTRADDLRAALDAWQAEGGEGGIPARDELRVMVDRIPEHAKAARERHAKPAEEMPMPDYLALVEKHNPRRRKKR